LVKRGITPVREVDPEEVEAGTGEVQ
jgi:hypothetical protein